MHYTITALAPDEQSLWTMKNGLLALGALLEHITLRPGVPGQSQAEITVKTTDLERSESYRDALELAGGTLLTSAEESSAHDAIT